MTGEVSVRFYRESDRGRVRHICLETARVPAFMKPDILSLYCDYYIEREPQHCLVAADGGDRAVGYLLLSRDWEEYREVFRSDYLPRLRKMAGHARRELDAKRALRAKYPAHLHIDILPGYTGSGIGRKLMDAGTQHLRLLGCPGIMLEVSASNTGAVRFYERCGFRKLRRTLTGICYGLDLQDGQVGPSFTLST